MFGSPSSVYQVQRGAAAVIKAAGTLVASEMILTTSGSFSAAALLNNRAAWVCTIANRTAADLLAAKYELDMTQQASWASGSMSEPGRRSFRPDSFRQGTQAAPGCSRHRRAPRP